MLATFFFFAKVSGPKSFVHFGQNVVAFLKVERMLELMAATTRCNLTVFFCVGLRFSTWKDAILLPALQVSVVPEVQTIEGCSAGGESLTFQQLEYCKQLKGNIGDTESLSRIGSY